MQTMPPAVSLDELPVLSDYELLEKIAEGSMASVYRGRHRANGKSVAIKIPLPEVVKNSILLERFRQEFRVGNTLNHKNIVRALDFGQEGTNYFLVMEFVEGQDLWHHIQKASGLTEAAAIEIIVEVSRGLHEAHKHGIIHRDIKPDNILISSSGEAKLADLGLSKDLEGELELTRPNKGLGTPNFMAPEQFSQACQADVRCDIYSLGATLYMAVTGKLPFAGRSLAAVLKKKINDELVPPRVIVPQLSERVEWTIRRALQSDPQRRYASCMEFIRALTGEKAEVETGRVPVPNTPQQRRPTRERRGHVRYPCTRATLCDLNTSIHDDDAETKIQWDGTIHDLSVKGIGLLLGRRFEPGTTMSLSLESPETGHKLKVEVRVSRVIRTRNRQWFLGGIFTQPLVREELIKLL
jgi:serine/threonine protein kinase